MRKLGVTEANAKSAIDKLLKRYKKVGQWREKVFRMFCSMSQPDGIGTRVVWNEPADYCETFLGFRRYYTLENKICKALFDLARNPITPGCTCAFPLRRGSKMWLTIIKVDGIHIDPESDTITLTGLNAAGKRTRTKNTNNCVVLR